MDRAQLLEELKELIVAECDTESGAGDLGAATTLIGSDSDLGLDSLDALQITLAVKQRYGTRIQGNNEARAALQNLASLADRILADPAAARLGATR